ncbi:hypothetical protein BKA67DRAFT_529673 [Truncatella angustata]|uniref:Uncharacterized protein n=1 Tax=Truncatella angustata TaxID=152316 RepID=A0A9P9A3R3_9PEZI|nr:uncharacterized protein BKA67DRAFT_529673 [Truncatella angustata]KAH6659525.1 hypothetical protein BKA67DRAFT_529673 [Truncatella angustata]KAH8198761.1 hypothetical protein TruAng_007081 [Truncatella angustata]
MADQVTDPYKSRAGYVEATDWAIPYWASYLDENRIGSHEMFSHVNCSYLSTPGRPPTLAALKKHAQSLVHLISTIAPSQGPGEIGNANSGDADAKKFVQDEAFDWLNNLEEVYISDDPNHHRPLNSLVNLAKSNSDTTGLDIFCPLCKIETKKSVKQEDAEAKAWSKNYEEQSQEMPFKRHWNLLRHANDCLEILDHEFSSTGGLLSILPTEHEVEAEQLDIAKNTLIGQWLLFTQQLVSRMHDLEIAYSNCLEVLNGEAIIPMQHMSVQGPDGRSGREVVFPQDRWILANAGDDVMTYIHQLLDKKQISEDASIQNYRQEGTTGNTLWDYAGDFERGIISVDLSTRFYRIKASASDRGPIFVLPAFGDRPGTKATRVMENRPTVVSVVDPELPLTQGPAHLAKQRDAHEEEIRALAAEKTESDQHIAELEGELKTYKGKAEYEHARMQSVLTTLTGGQQKAAEDFAALRKELMESQQREREKEQQKQDVERQLNDLLSNNYSQNKAAGVIPRDIEGHVAEKALKALLDAVKKTQGENVRLSNTVHNLQNQARENAQLKKTINSLQDEAKKKAIASV